MSVWMEIYEEADQLIKHFKARKTTGMTIEEFQAIGSGLSLKLKAARGEASCEIASLKNAGLKRSLKSKRLIANDGQAMGGNSATPIEEEKVKCLIQGNSCISRSSCVRASGISENYEECKECENYSVNRDLVLGPKPYVA